MWKIVSVTGNYALIGVLKGSAFLAYKLVVFTIVHFKIKNYDNNTHSGKNILFSLTFDVLDCAEWRCMDCDFYGD